MRVSVQAQIEDMMLDVAESQLRAQLHNEERARLEMEKAREEARAAKFIADHVETRLELPRVKGMSS